MSSASAWWLVEPTRTQVPASAGCTRGVRRSKYVDGRRRRDGLTSSLKASPSRGIVATRTELDLADPSVVEMPAALPAWLIDS